MSTITKLLSFKKYIVLNKDLISILGLQEAMMIGELCSIENFAEEQNLLEDGWFFAKVDKIQKDTSFSEYVQNRIISTLKELDIIDIKYQGMPRTRYIKLNEDTLEKILVKPTEFSRDQKIKSLDDSGKETEKLGGLETEKFGDYIIYNNNKYNNNKYMITEPTTMESSNKNATKILENKNTKNNQEESTHAPVQAPKVGKPVIKAGLTVPKYVLSRLDNLNVSNEAKEKLKQYCLFLKDVHSYKEETIWKRIQEVCNVSHNYDTVIMQVVDYNIDKGSYVVWTPGDMKSLLARGCTQQSVVSQPTEITQEEWNNMEEIW